MHVGCDNLCETGAEGGIILGQLMLSECMGICILILTSDGETRGSLIYLLTLLTSQAKCSDMWWLAVRNLTLIRE